MILLKCFLIHGYFVNYSIITRHLKKLINIKFTYITINIYNIFYSFVFIYIKVIEKLPKGCNHRKNCKNVEESTTSKKIIKDKLQKQTGLITVVLLIY